jgi:hypothetical protein
VISTWPAVAFSVPCRQLTADTAIRDNKSSLVI